MKRSSPDGGISASGQFSRRDLLRTAGAAPAAAALSRQAAAADGTTAALPALQPFQIKVNGKEHTLDIDPRLSLLDLLRERLDLTDRKSVV